ncbi:hypothetical protein [Pontibacillus sp. HMF3514]|nr:hypothetical protein [Pontibacillus sp. HMF3514]QHE51375.1 hypothetical protein GS400_04710 [Pontibacillus sp. HMF3514]
MDPNEYELQTYTPLNPDFGMHDKGYTMHVKDIDDFYNDEADEADYH